MMMNQNNPLALVKSEHRVALVTHVHPDGDAYGAMLGLKQILLEKALLVDAFADSDSLSKYAFLPSFSELKGYEDMGDVAYDLCFVLDCGNKERVGRFSSLLSLSKIVVNIDHHISNTGFGHIDWIDSSASSTSEILVSLASDVNSSVSADAATCLLTGIIMDTGSFIYDSTTKNTHIATAFLLDQGADHASIRYNLFQNRPLQNVKFLGYLIEHMELMLDNQVVMLMVSNDLLTGFNVAYEDLDEFNSYVRDISGVELAIIFKELSPGETKVSMRSKRWFNVNELASNFNGGGHERAAGAVIQGNLTEVRQQMIPLIKTAFNGGQLV